MSGGKTYKVDRAVVMYRMTKCPTCGGDDLGMLLGQQLAEKGARLSKDGRLAEPYTCELAPDGITFYVRVVQRDR